MSVEETVEVQITVAGADITGDVVWTQTSFTAVAAAQPGTAMIVVRDPTGKYSFEPGTSLIRCLINGDLVWQGYLFTVDQGYFFEASPVRKWTLSGVDLNILFDKLILYNHAHPTWSLDGGGYYQREQTEGGFVVAVPRRTSDRSYIQHMLNDTDLNLITPTINTTRLIGEVGSINPDGTFTPPSPGLTLRAFMLDVSANVMRSEPGSSIWYINPAGYLVYQSQDSDYAPWPVGQSEALVADCVPVKRLSVTTDISRIKNDVLIFTGNLNPLPNSPQSAILYRHDWISQSISRYGRFQYSEVMGTDWLQGSINVRADKILFQEGGPSMRAEFTVYKHGLFPGQIVTIISDQHTFRWYDTVLGSQSGHEIRIPIRALEITFETPNIASYRATCSFDTQDPWGLLLALKRPPTRGLVQPPFNVIDRTKSPPDPWTPAQTYMFVREYPVSLGGGNWKCHYAYIRYSLTVFVNGIRRVGLPEGEGSTVGFIETNPNTGVFHIDTGRPYVEYHVWHDLETQ